MELAIKQPNAAFHLAPPLLQERLFLSGVLCLPIGTRLRCDCDAFSLETCTLLLIRPIGIVAQEVSAERCREEGIETLDIVPIAGNLQNEGDSSARGENQVLPYAMEPALQGCAVSAPGQAIETLLLPSPDRTTYIYGMGVYNEKGGEPSASSSQKAWVSC